MRIKLTGTAVQQPHQGWLGGETGQGGGKTQQKTLYVTLPLIKSVSGEGTTQTPHCRAVSRWGEAQVRKTKGTLSKQMSHTATFTSAPSHTASPTSFLGCFFWFANFSQTEVQWWQAGVQTQNWTNKKNSDSEIPFIPSAVQSLACSKDLPGARSCQLVTNLCKSLGSTVPDATFLTPRLQGSFLSLETAPFSWAVWCAGWSYWELNTPEQAGRSRSSHFLTTSWIFYNCFPSGSWFSLCSSNSNNSCWEASYPRILKAHSYSTHRPIPGSLTMGFSFGQTSQLQWGEKEWTGQVMLNVSGFFFVFL